MSINGGCTTSSSVVEFSLFMKPSLTIVVFLSPSQLMHNEAQKHYFFLGNSTWAR
jgi:hypothetical protein